MATMEAIRRGGVLAVSGTAACLPYVVAELVAPDAEGWTGWYLSFLLLVATVGVVALVGSVVLMSAVGLGAPSLRVPVWFRISWGTVLGAAIVAVMEPRLSWADSLAIGLGACAGGVVAVVHFAVRWALVGGASLGLKAEP